MTQQAHIETVTKGPNQRVRRTIAYLVVANRKVLARFDIASDDRAGGTALALAREALLRIGES